MRGNVYRDGKLYVCDGMCSTCIFRPGNLMHLRSGRVRQMVDEALANESTIVCHQTLDGDNAACYGFFKRHRNGTLPLRLGQVMGIITYMTPKEYEMDRTVKTLNTERPDEPITLEFTFTRAEWQLLAENEPVPDDADEGEVRALVTRLWTDIDEGLINHYSLPAELDGKIPGTPNQSSTA